MKQKTLAAVVAAPPCFAVPVLEDNYAWVVVGQNNQAVVIDPGEATPVVAALARHSLHLSGILLTHHHHDHVGGVPALVDAAQAHQDMGPDALPVYGSHYDVQRCRIPRASKVACDETPLTVAGIRFVPLMVPGHTLGAVAYHVPDRQLLFTGDTLFLAGCGRLFEGDANAMWQSLVRLRALPAATRVCCGHDYLAKNLRFADTVLPSQDVRCTDPAAVRRATLADGGDESSPPLPPPWATLGTERRRNPFLRADEPQLLASTGKGDAVAAFAALRQQRDAFR